ncbi:type II toxin-antitoxin system ParD family antitoxin [Massilia sp. PAMC28688]|uniref:ribbon-helix-helix domain-containing protein n=1 Tax=Massilia sp. PAMC28688 TaxID=2861283 RepID=UPI001C62A819|nr:type II toxin-antitoxin system ParD family antitoxin [Massilia sp. PAMC28688]QYF93149.1 type II toxin-antitoxin system ParD family antitoxin [Massilia sp. PAMC28688]
MGATRQLSITLPPDLADAVEEMVRAGQYASESEMVHDGLRILLARDVAVETWLLEEVGPAYDALKNDPGRALSVDQVRARLAAEDTKTR